MTVSLAVAPVPGPQTVSVLIWSSIFSSTAAATIKKVRSIEAEVKSANRPPTSDEVARISELNARMKKLYDDAFQKAGGKR